jgi:hypothetical protein
MNHASVEYGGGHARDAEGLEIAPPLRFVLDVEAVEGYSP